MRISRFSIKKNTFFERDMLSVNLIDLWNKFAKVMKSFMRSWFPTYFISMSSMKRNQLKCLQGALRDILRFSFSIKIKNVGLRGSYFGAHSCSTNLYAVLANKHNNVQLEDMYKDSVDGC